MHRVATQVLPPGVTKECLEEIQILDPSKHSYVDTHCHLDKLWQRYYGKRTLDPQILRQRFLRNSQYSFGVTFPGAYKSCITSFCFPADYIKKKGLNEQTKAILKIPDVYASIGIHPHSADLWSATVGHVIEKTVKNYSNVIAIGEIGFDQSEINRVPLAVQTEVFERCLEIAIKLQLPIVLHVRNSEQECFESMAKFPALRHHHIHRHCFSESYEWAEKWMASYPNMKFGLTPRAVDNAQLLRTFSRLDISRLLIETDAPFCTTYDLKCIRYKHNEPSFASIPLVAIHRMNKDKFSLKKTADILHQNFLTVYMSGPAANVPDTEPESTYAMDVAENEMTPADSVGAITSSIPSFQTSVCTDPLTSTAAVSSMSTDTTHDTVGPTTVKTARIVVPWNRKAVFGPGFRYATSADLDMEEEQYLAAIIRARMR